MSLVLLFFFLFETVSLCVAQVSLVLVILLLLFLKCLDYRLVPSYQSCLYDLICVLLCVHVHVFLYIRLPLCVPACESQKTSAGGHFSGAIHNWLIDSSGTESLTGLVLVG